MSQSWLSQEPSSGSNEKKASPTTTSGKKGEEKARGPHIPHPEALPASVDTKGEVKAVPEADSIVKDQQGMRKKLREEQKAAAAEKEAQKAAKQVLQKEKDAAKEKKKLKRQRNCNSRKQQRL